jgi:hypothetical protein
MRSCRQRQRLFGLAALGCAFLVLTTPAWAEDIGIEVKPNPTPAYRIQLGPRKAQGVPNRTHCGETCGGYIDVKQPLPNVLVVTMRGAAVAGADCKGGLASIAFDLDQEFTVIPTRAGSRAPVLRMSAWVVGVLDTCDKGGSADHGEACASVVAGDHGVLTLCVPPQSAADGHKLCLNNRAGPGEALIAPGCYSLRQTFHIAASQSKSLCCDRASAADFDHNLQFDPKWKDLVKAFRAVPRTDYGFRVVLWVGEEPSPGVATEKKP